MRSGSGYYVVVVCGIWIRGNANLTVSGKGRSGLTWQGMLAVVPIHGISAGVMERVLNFVYIDSFPRGLGAEWLTPAGAERLFNAADMLLLFSMKVGVQRLCVIWPIVMASPPTNVKSSGRLQRTGVQFSKMGLK